MRLQRATVDVEELGTVDVEFYYYEGEPERGEWMFSLGEPAVPPEIDIVSVYLDSKDVTYSLTEYEMSAIEDELWAITPEDF